ELHRMALASVSDRGHSALVRGQLFGGRFLGTGERGKQDIERREPGAEPNHDENGNPAVHASSTPSRRRCPLGAPAKTSNPPPLVNSFSSAGEKKRAGSARTRRSPSRPRRGALKLQMLSQPLQQT